MKPPHLLYSAACQCFPSDKDEKLNFKPASPTGRFRSRHRSRGGATSNTYRLTVWRTEGQPKVGLPQAGKLHVWDEGLHMATQVKQSQFKPLPKSLALVTAYYPPAIGGVERYTQEFARAAVDMGVKANVIATGPVKKPEVAVEDNGINVLRIPAQNIPMSGSYFPIPMGGAKRVAEFLRCDVVLAQTRFFLTSLMAATIAATQGKRIYVVDHGSGPLRSTPIVAMASMAYEHSVTLALKCFRPKFYGVSTASVQWLRHFNICEAAIIPNGITLRSGSPKRDTSTFDEPIVFFAGRLLPDKGIRELVDAVDILVNEGHRIKLRIAGPGPLGPMLKERAAASSFLTYLGSISSQKVEEELNRASILVNPSNYSEGFSRIVLEAGASAIPVVSTPRGACTDLIKDGQTGWLIARGDAQIIASCLREVMAHPSEAIRRGNELFQLVQENYTWPFIVQNFLCQIGSESPR